MFGIYLCLVLDTVPVLLGTWLVVGICHSQLHINPKCFTGYLESTTLYFLVLSVLCTCWYFVLGTGDFVLSHPGQEDAACINSSLYNESEKEVVALGIIFDQSIIQNVS